MPKIIPKYRCKLCDEYKNTKQAWERHMIICRYKHMTQKERDLQETTLLTPQQMCQMIMDLTIKCDTLERKLERVQINQSAQSKKSIMQYLNSCLIPRCTFTKWAESIVINKQHLKLFFDENLLKAITNAVTNIYENMDNLPIRNYSLKPTHVYIYDIITPNVFEWKQMDTNDWKRFCRILTNKISVLYFQWKKENREQIDNNPEFAEASYNYGVQINHRDDIPIKPIKESIIKQIQSSFTSLEA